MTANVGNTDRLVRAVIGVIAVVVALVLGITSIAGLVLIVVAVIGIGTALAGWCPLYRIFGIDTCSKSGS
jgi:hypothetical protein